MAATPAPSPSATPIRQAMSRADEARAAARDVSSQFPIRTPPSPPNPTEMPRPAAVAGGVLVAVPASQTGGMAGSDISNRLSPGAVSAPVLRPTAVYGVPRRVG